MVPSEIKAGFDFVIEIKDGGQYVPDGYTPKFVIGGAGSLVKIGEVVDGHLKFEFSASDTQVFTTGRYWYQVVAENDADGRTFIQDGSVLINGYISGTGTYDGRSAAEKIVEAIDLTILGRATTDQQSYMIQSGAGSRSLSRIPVEELRLLRKEYAAIVAAEKRQKSSAPLFKRHTFEFVDA